MPFSASLCQLKSTSDLLRLDVCRPAAEYVKPPFVLGVCDYRSFSAALKHSRPPPIVAALGWWPFTLFCSHLLFVRLRLAPESPTLFARQDRASRFPLPGSCLLITMPHITTFRSRVLRSLTLPVNPTPGKHFLTCFKDDPPFLSAVLKEGRSRLTTAHRAQRHISL